MRVMESLGYRARCEGRGASRWLDLALVGEQPVGTWLLAFVDTARQVLDADAAARLDAALDGLEAAFTGQAGDQAVDLSAFFPDLVGREPQLPEHLRNGTP